LGCTSMPFSTRWMGMGVRRASNSLVRLRKSGERCCTTTNATPTDVGMRSKRRSRASRPPAEAPTPTTWNGDVAGSAVGTGMIAVFVVSMATFLHAPRGFVHLEQATCQKCPVRAIASLMRVSEWRANDEPALHSDAGADAAVG